MDSPVRSPIAPWFDICNQTASNLQRLRPLKPGEVILDIGGNDGTSLRGYSSGHHKKSAWIRPGSNSPLTTIRILVPNFFNEGRSFEASEEECQHRDGNRDVLR